MVEALLELNPEIYGLIADPESVELDGLLYIFQRLPKGIEACRYIKLISREGFENSDYPTIIPAKRRRNCYRVDKEQMYIEMTRGRSDIYDVLTHLTFLYIEAEKIRKNSLDHKGKKRRDWKVLEKLVRKMDTTEEVNLTEGYTYLSTIIGRTYEETVKACQEFDTSEGVNSLFKIVYWLGRISIEEATMSVDREISFSPTLREKLGHHIYGAQWANNIKQLLDEKGLLERPIHVISSNLHSVLNSFYGKAALEGEVNYENLEDLAEKVSQGGNRLRHRILNFAEENGMDQLSDNTGTNIGVQIFDLSKMDCAYFPKELNCKLGENGNDQKVIIVMDYAFGEQAYECMDELLKPYLKNGVKVPLNVQSVAVMGKAGILEGGKGDIMIPDAHVFEGTADNYPFENSMDTEIFKGSGLGVYKGPMITVLGTSLQNRDILYYFLNSSWKASGLEMEGAHYQKAIQSASRIRKSIKPDVQLRYAYYASDNPLKTGSTLASGGLGVGGVKPTYLITLGILNGIMGK